MIRKNQDCVRFSKTMFGGPGEVNFTELLKVDEFLGHGRLFNRVCLKPGCRLGKHTHVNDFEVYHILSGKGVYSDNGTLTELLPGDVAICPEGESHYIENQGPEDLEFVALILFDKKD